MANEGAMNLSDQELLKATSAARGAAHRALLARTFDENAFGKPTGRKLIEEDGHTSAWASRGRDFAKLAAEVARRGLEIPPCDCPPGTKHPPE